MFKKIIPGLSALGAFSLLIAMLIWPGETYQGALYGLELWATILVPSLFPFFIMTEVLLKLGLVQMFGVLLEPIMRPLFNLPGTASFVVAMGFTSGFPMGAVLTRRLYEENECTRSEAERLVAFTNNSSPLFILVAVAVGLFHNPFLGIVLACSHYLANILIGILLGLSSPRLPFIKQLNKHLLRKSLHILFQTPKNNRPWGLLLSEAIKLSTNNICLIGGFVIIFAILINILQITSLQALLEYPCRLLLSLIRLNPTLDASMATGCWEMTLGLKNTSLAPAAIREKALIASVLLGWSGLSIQAQVTSVLAGSGISPRLYYQCRLLQGFFSGIITYILTLNKDWLLLLSAPAFTPLPSTHHFFSLIIFNFLYTWQFFCYAVLSLFLLSGLSIALNRH